MATKPVDEDIADGKENLMAQGLPVTNILSRYLDTNGDGTGTNEIQGDHSSTEQVYLVMPPRGERYLIRRFVIFIDGSGSLGEDEYANLGAPLTNGLVLRVRRHTESDNIFNLTDDVPIKTNAHWLRHTEHVHRWEAASGADALSAVIDFQEAFHPDGLLLDGEKGDALELVAQDDFSGAQIVEHRALVEGWILGPSAPVPEGISSTAMRALQVTTFP